MVSVSIVEDNKQVAEGLRHTINFHDGFSILSVYGNSEKALESLPNENPDIILLDVYLPGTNGVESIRDIKEIAPDVEIIMLTSSDKEEHIFESLRAGAAGYIMKNSGASQIIDSIKTVLDGGAPMSKEVARKVISSFRTTAPSPKPDYEFTGRETEILHLLADAQTIKEISAGLHIEQTTVKYHLSNIYKKMGVRSKSEAISKILKENLV